ncbi:MAG: hypothetical protein JWM91_645 [Rhodospirillales bacterium]|nr:hypothetical protein [Rhodospirillales bacterium]
MSYDEDVRDLLEAIESISGFRNRGARLGGQDIKTKPDLVCGTTVASAVPDLGHLVDDAISAALQN